uniref:Protein kinase domain-containing protein n=1 Tax=Strigamia maritima TaxID=126957 RepID=T1IQJ3_STRMM
MGNLSSKKSIVHDNTEEVDFDHFQILRAIGKGSFGKVCIVQRIDSKKMYAMKYMNKMQCIEKDAVRNVLREIEILAVLNHPFLVNMWFSFQDAEDMFMVVDLLLGGDIRYHIQQSGRFDEYRVKLYICELALALDYLQEQHVIHRDIKPDNILLDEDGHVHITDFNIATVLHDKQLATSMTGTKPYMAPEVFDCAVDECPGYSYAVDWWSLGICAYEMLRCKRPFDIHSGTSIMEVRQMFALYNVHFSASLSSGMKDLLKKLLCVKSENRITRLVDLMKIPYLQDIDPKALLEKKISPPYVPPKDHLNCDPTFELEEMIIEARPLHKKKKRLSKQNYKREQQHRGSVSGLITDPLQARLQEINDEFNVYNREKEKENKERERKEQEWQKELDEDMRKADPHADYRRDLKLALPVPTALLRLSPSMSRSRKSPSTSTDTDADTKKTTAVHKATSPMKWLESPRKDKPILKPFQSIDRSAGDSDSSSESIDRDAEMTTYKCDSTHEKHLKTKCSPSSKRTPESISSKQRRKQKISSHIGYNRNSSSISQESETDCPFYEPDLADSKITENKENQRKDSIS